MGKATGFAMLLGMLVVVGATGAILFDRYQPTQLLEGSELQALDLEALPSNRWLSYHQPLRLDWRRQGHAGIAYDTHRATFYIFGSDVHGQNWDNSVHEFDPETREWTTHYAPAGPDSYRVDERGFGVSGGARVLPWAMHSYDNVLYDPVKDALVVISRPEHNPIGKRRGLSPRVHPVWSYSLEKRAWGVLGDAGQWFPGNFGGASAYDAERRTVVSYGARLAELGPQRDLWQKVKVRKPHHIHYSMEYDTDRKQLMVFGDFGNSNKVWVYTPGATPGVAGTWEERSPAGDHCPPDQHFPVAFDEHNGVFLLVPDNNPDVPVETGGKRKKAASSSTFVYDPASNQYRKLPDADMPAQGMNYMMVYDSRRRVFFLVTGDWRRPPVVWVLRLEPELLE